MYINTSNLLYLCVNDVMQQQYCMSGAESKYEVEEGGGTAG